MVARARRFFRYGVGGNPYKSVIRKGRIFSTLS